MKSCIQFYAYAKRNMKKQLTYMKELFSEKIEPIFMNIEEEAETYTNKIWDEAIRTPCYDENPDLSRIAEACQDAGVERYEILSLMRYRNLVMWISCIYQVWEQQIIGHIKLETKQRRTIIVPDSIDFFGVKDCFAFHNYKIEDMECWNKIKELRLFVNVIKHAEGKSADRLRVLRPDFFQYEDGLFFCEGDKLHTDMTTLLNETLNVTSKDFDDYYQSLIAFWDELPEIICSDEL